MFGWMTVWRAVAAASSLVLLAGCLAVGLDVRSAGSSRARYSSELSRLDAELSSARRAGYDEASLDPIRRQAGALGSQPSPFAGVEPGYYRQLEARVRDLEARLQDTEQREEAATRQDVDQQLAAARSTIDQGRQADLPDAQAASLGARVDAAAKEETEARDMAGLKKADADARAAADAAGQALAAQQAENAALQQAATALAGQAPAALQQAGQAALSNGRNDASLAAYEEKAGRFPAKAAMDEAYWRLEHYAPRLGSSDPQQLAYGVAALQRYSNQIHELLLANLGPQHIVVSFQAQHVWAYEGSKVVMNSPVTTGIQGSGAFGTDFGPMQVLHKDHPWKMHSPWPKGSPYWYPDTVVQWTVFFTWSGEAFHDAYWEPDSELGPGSQYDLSTRSHGCVHLPYSLAEWMYNWAQVGTPVDVYPGDGQPVAQQLAEMTTDSQGNPLNPA